MNQSGQTEEMVCVPMSDENRRQVNPSPTPHHLALRALTTIEQDRFAVSFYQDRRKTPGDGGH
jgi:hypothetical protein